MYSINMYLRVRVVDGVDVAYIFYIILENLTDWHLFSVDVITCGSLNIR